MKCVTRFVLPALATMCLLAPGARVLLSADSTAASTQTAATTKPVEAWQTEAVKLLRLKSSDSKPAPVEGFALFDARRAGMIILARTTLAEAHIVSAAKPITLNSFTDDGHTDFGKGRPESEEYYVSRQTGNNPRITVDADKKGCRFELYSPKLPADGATMITVRGTLPLRVALGDRTKVLKKQSLKLGQSFTVEDTTFTVMSIASPSNEDDRQSISLTCDQAAESVRTITLADTAGKVIPSTFAVSAQDRRTLVLQVPRPVTEATITMSFFDTVSELDVPFELKVKVTP